MQPSKAMLSVLQLFASFSFFSVSIFFFVLPFSPVLRVRLSDALLTSPKFCVTVGIALMSASFFLMGGFYFLSRGRNLIIKMKGKNAASLHTNVIQKTLEECFKSHFKGKILLSDVSVVQGSELEIEVFFIPFEENLREELFTDVQKKIAPLLEEKFGYSKSFCFVVKSYTKPTK